jgi:hypothetical protein
VPGRWERRLSFPLSGCLDYQKHLARSGAYRFFLADAYAYRKSLRLTIEHAPEANRGRADYVGVAYFYSEEPPSGLEALPRMAERGVHDLERLVFTPGWNVPVHAFSFRNATLAKKEERIGGENLRYFRMQAEGEEVFGPHYIAFVCEMPASGRYRVALEAVEGPAQGKVQLFQNEHPAGEAVDLYAPERKKTSLLPLGTLDLKEGPNEVFLKLVGKNPASTGLGLEVVRLQFEREPPAPEPGSRKDERR